jgi:hypothetical protein
MEILEEEKFRDYKSKEGLFKDNLVLSATQSKKVRADATI